MKVVSSPSLALIKYWGKNDLLLNLPATSSLAIGLEDLKTETIINISDTPTDAVTVNGLSMPSERYTSFFDAIRHRCESRKRFQITSTSSFPVAAGIASSSSGFAALAFGCCRLLNPDISIQEISDLARIGSASASRALFSGFTTLNRGAHNADPFYPADYWPELRVLIAVVKGGVKPISSREAMELSRTTSPYYPAWLEDSEHLFNQALVALQKKDLSLLGPLIRQSYLKMFGTMTSCSPPVIYWDPNSLALIHGCEKLRQQGLNVWETMDAGPQVKVICLAEEEETVLKKLQQAVAGEGVWIRSCIGGGTYEVCG